MAVRRDDRTAADVMAALSEAPTKPPRVRPSHLRQPVEEATRCRSCEALMFRRPLGETDPESRPARNYCAWCIATLKVPAEALAASRARARRK